MSSGLCLAYIEGDAPPELVLDWLTESGESQRQDRFPFYTLVFGWGEGDEMRLIERTSAYEPPDLLYGYCVRRYTLSAGELSCDTLLWVPIAASSFSNTSAFTISDRQLVGADLTVNLAMPVWARVRILRYQDGQGNSSEPWVLSPLGQDGASYPVMAAGPDGSFVLGMQVHYQGVRTLQWRAFDAVGAPAGPTHEVWLGQYGQVNGLAALVCEDAVLYSYTAASYDPRTPSGAYAAAFPLRYVLDSPGRPRSAVHDLSVTAYPNPFNGETRFALLLPVAGNATLSVYDLAGRCVARLASGFRPAGSVEYDWRADDLPSGVYFARLHAGRMDVTSKVVLIR